MKDTLLAVIESNASAEGYTWLKEKAALIKDEERSVQLNMAFSQLPRHIGKSEVLHVDGSTQGIDRLSRIWLLTQLPDSDRSVYVKKINSLVTGAEMNELAAIYSALPYLSYPEEWIGLCEEGIRSNIGLVLEAIMYENPYPAEHLSENSFNQLVLKAFFTEKDVTRILGLESRMNDKLAETLKDYVAERRAAGREIEPNIFKLIELRNQI